LRALLTAMFAAKRAKAREDPELFATFRVLAAEHSTGVQPEGIEQGQRPTSNG
jgi:hypothetical protein